MASRQHDWASVPPTSTPVFELSSSWPLEMCPSRPLWMWRKCIQTHTNLLGAVYVTLARLLNCFCPSLGLILCLVGSIIRLYTLPCLWCLPRHRVRPSKCHLFMRTVPSNPRKLVTGAVCIRSPSHRHQQAPCI